MTLVKRIEDFRKKYDNSQYQGIIPDKDLEDFISQVEKDAIEKTNKRWREGLFQELGHEWEDPDIAGQIPGLDFKIDPVITPVVRNQLRRELREKLSDLLEDK